MEIRFRAKLRPCAVMMQLGVEINRASNECETTYWSGYIRRPLSSPGKYARNAARDVSKNKPNVKW